MNVRAATAGEHAFYVAAAIGIVVVVLAGFSIDLPLLTDLGSVSALVRVQGNGRSGAETAFDASVQRPLAMRDQRTAECAQQIVS